MTSLETGGVILHQTLRLWQATILSISRGNVRRLRSRIRQAYPGPQSTKVGVPTPQCARALPGTTTAQVITGSGALPRTLRSQILIGGQPIFKSQLATATASIAAQQPSMAVRNRSIVWRVTQGTVGSVSLREIQQSTVLPRQQDPKKRSQQGWGSEQ